MQKQLILAGLMTMAGTALASTTNMENPLYKNKQGVSSLITADQDSADQYCLLNGFTASEDFEVTYKSSQSWTYDGEKWILEDTDAVLKSVECQGDRAEVEPYGRRYPKRPGRRYPGRHYPGGGYPGGGYPGGGYPGGGYPGGGYPGGGYPGGGYPGGGYPGGGYPGGGYPGGHYPGGHLKGCYGKITGKWYRSGERTSFPIRGRYYRCVNGQWRSCR